MIDLKKLTKAGVQFGHQTWRWSPKMANYIWGEKDGIHLIDVSKTARQMERAAKFLEEVAAEGKQIMLVGTKSAARRTIEEMGQRLGCPFVTNRWVGGTLSNFSQVKKSVTKLLHFEDVIRKFDQQAYTKKEYGVFQKIVDRLQRNVGSIRNLAWPIGAIVVVDAGKEATAIKEAQLAGIPVVALVDTNSDPSGVSIVIPGNDDIARSIRVVFEELVVAIERGIEQAKANQVSVAAAEKPAERDVAAPDLAGADLLGATEEDAAAAPRPPSRARRAPSTKPAAEQAPALVEEPVAKPAAKAAPKKAAAEKKVAEAALGEEPQDK